MINIYLFMRLGALVTVFTEARFSLESLARAYFAENSWDKLQITFRLTPAVLFTTDSFFEYLHRKEINLAIFWYSLFIAVVMGTGHAASIYLLSAFFQNDANGALVDFLFFLRSFRFTYLIMIEISI